MSINKPLLSLDIIGGNKLTNENCALKMNQTELLCRGTYDYCHGMRDEMVINRGYSLPPYYQTEWAFNRKNYWTPAVLENLETWFSPEYFHPETTATTLCIEMENRSTTAYASGNAEATVESNMATLTTTEGRHRGLAALDFDGNTDRYIMENTTDWNASTYNWFCCIMVHGGTIDTDDLQHLVEKGSRFNFTLDWSGGNKNAIFNYGDGISTAALTLVGAAQWSSTTPTIISFGRLSGHMFLRVIRNAGSDTVTAAKFIGDMDQSTKPKIGYDITIGTTKYFDGEFVELIWLHDHHATEDLEATDANVLKVEGYLAHKYGVSKDVLPADHTYYSEPPREN
jgi:hypothetical protein